MFRCTVVLDHDVKQTKSEVNNCGCKRFETPEIKVRMIHCDELKDRSKMYQLNLSD